MAEFNSTVVFGDTTALGTIKCNNIFTHRVYVTFSASMKIAFFYYSTSPDAQITNYNLVCAFLRKYQVGVPCYVISGPTTRNRNSYIACAWYGSGGIIVEGTNYTTATSVTDTVLWRV